ncbi:MAG: hypothetical protein CMH49_08970 [Myxococcales bacterium]|nr:hypothetical protein [Myxococcales bacterium]
MIRKHARCRRLSANDLSPQAYKQTKLEQALLALPFELSVRKLMKTIEYQVYDHLKKHSYINHGAAHHELKEEVSQEVLCFFMSDKGLDYLSKTYNLSYIQYIAKSRAIDYLKSFSKHAKYELSANCFEAQNDDEQVGLDYLSHNDDLYEEDDIALKYQKTQEIKQANELLLETLLDMPTKRRSAFIIKHWDNLVLIAESMEKNSQYLAQLVSTKDLDTQTILQAMSLHQEVSERWQSLFAPQSDAEQAKKRLNYAYSQNLSRAKRLIRTLVLSELDVRA